MYHGKRKEQPRELNDQDKEIIIAVRHCSRELDDILQGARRKAQSNSKIFAESGVSTMFRGIESYADMYEKLKVKSRETLDHMFQRAHDVDGIQDAQDVLEETEGCWRNLLSNIDKELSFNHKVGENNNICKLNEGDYMDLSKTILWNFETNIECSLETAMDSYTSLLVVCQPAYLPNVGLRWRHSAISKVLSDFHNFNMGCVVVTWGPEEVVKKWSKQVLKHLKWPVFWDKNKYFPVALQFDFGCAALWAPEMLDFCGCQRAVHKHSVEPPPNNIDWLSWPWVGGELVIASPYVTRLLYKKQLELSTKSSDDINETECEIDKPQPPPSSKSSKLIKLHRCSHLADLAPAGSVYQAALFCHAKFLNLSEATVLDDIRIRRRLSTPPESGRLQFEAQTGLHYDPETELYYDANSGYFYDSFRSTYYYWSQTEYRYIPANDMVQADIIAAQNAQVAAAHAAASRALAERQAAMAAGAKVAAQLAAIRSQKDEYSAYAYATCVLSQHTEFEDSNIDPIKTSHSLTKRQKLSLDNSDPNRTECPFSYAANNFNCPSRSHYSCPPPPGL